MHSDYTQNEINLPLDYILGLYSYSYVVKIIIAHPPLLFDIAHDYMSLICHTYHIKLSKRDTIPTVKTYQLEIP